MKMLFAALIGIFLVSTVSAEDLQLSQEQHDVWAGEEAYWRYVNAGKTEDFLVLWHDEFVGWPCDSEVPADLSYLKLNVADWFANVAANEQKTSIEPEGVIVEDGFAITYLSAKTVWIDSTGDEKSMLEKIVHTWKKTDDGWKIIGGMCGPLVRQ